jgi:hypothetical protein
MRLFGPSIVGIATPSNPCAAILQVHDSRARSSAGR